MNNTITWTIKSFDELTPAELYSILQLRNEVFVVEQNCVFQDADNKDQTAVHLMGMIEDKLIAYTRILPPGLTYQHPSIGRVATSPAARNSGFGRELMERSITETRHLFGPLPIQIGAQFYLKKFYESLGFRQSSEIYLEDGIEHIEMLLSL
jgi:ElaA protein